MTNLIKATDLCSASYGEGLPPIMASDSVDVGWDQNDTIFARPPGMKFQQKLHRIQAAAMVAMMRNGSSPNTKSLDSGLQANVMSSLVKLFDSQVMSLAHECHGVLSK